MARTQKPDPTLFPVVEPLPFDESRKTSLLKDLQTFDFETNEPKEMTAHLDREMTGFVQAQRYDELEQIVLTLQEAHGTYGAGKRFTWFIRVASRLMNTKVNLDGSSRTWRQRESELFAWMQRGLMPMRSKTIWHVLRDAGFYRICVMHSVDPYPLIRQFFGTIKEQTNLSHSVESFSLAIDYILEHSTEPRFKKFGRALMHHLIHFADSNPNLLPLTKPALSLWEKQTPLAPKNKNTSNSLCQEGFNALAISLVQKNTKASIFLLDLFSQHFSPKVFAEMFLPPPSIFKRRLSALFDVHKKTGWISIVNDSNQFFSAAPFKRIHSFAEFSLSCLKIDSFHALKRHFPSISCRLPLLQEGFSVAPVPHAFVTPDDFRQIKSSFLLTRNFVEHLCLVNGLDAPSTDGKRSAL
jgi:hypothetical protein